MKKQLNTFFLFMLLILLPRTAEACMACWNSATAVQAPFVGSLIGVFVGWLVISLFVKRPLATGVKRFLIFGVPVLIWGTFIMNPLGFGLPLMLCWIFYLLFKVLQFLTIKDEWLRENLIPFGLNAIALTVAFVFIFITTTQANSTPGLIDSLGKVGPHTSATVHNQISKLAKRGPDVVAPLSAALEWDFETDYVSPYRTAQIAYCLRQIGGEQAEAALKRTIEQHITFDEDFYGKWETTVCCLYAECAQERAVPTLMELLNSAEGERADQQKLIALLALARTQDSAAMETVLDHSGFLQEQLKKKYIRHWSSAMISVTLQALAEGQIPADLSASPIYEPLRLGLRPDSRTKTGIQWDERWNGEFDTDALNAKWSQLLK